MKKFISERLLLVIFIVGLVGCSNLLDHKTEGSKVDAVYWHEGNKYSVAAINSNEVTIKRLPYNIPVRVHLDVKRDEKAWYECDYIYSDWDGYKSGECNIHIHSIHDLTPAGWNHGKFGSGATIRID